MSYEVTLTVTIIVLFWCRFFNQLRGSWTGFGKGWGTDPLQGVRGVRVRGPPRPLHGVRGVRVRGAPPLTWCKGCKGKGCASALTLTLTPLTLTYMQVREVRVRALTLTYMV